MVPTPEVMSTSSRRSSGLLPQGPSAGESLRTTLYEKLPVFTKRTSLSNAYEHSVFESPPSSRTNSGADSDDQKNFLLNHCLKIFNRFLNRNNEELNSRLELINYK